MATAWEMRPSQGGPFRAAVPAAASELDLNAETHPPVGLIRGLEQVVVASAERAEQTKISPAPA